MHITIPWAERRDGRFDIHELDIEPSNTALLIVDVQRGYVEPEAGVGPTLKGHPDIFNYYYPRLSDVVLPNIVRLIDFFRAHGLEVVFTRQGFMTPDARDLPPWNWRHAQVGTREARIFWVGSPEAELMPELAQADDLIVDKSSSGPFATSGLDQYLRNMSIENVVIAGVLTNVAVETAARDAGDRGYNVIAVDDACAAYWPEEHSDTMATASWWVAKSTETVVTELTPGLGH
ncbi:MAG: isochorismatase family cysteine hydrolase [Dehalococcoidia bacterium]